MQPIPITRTSSPAPKPQSEENLGFGQIFTDHMFLMDYEEGKGWHDPRIEPYQPIALDPSAMVFHYGQAIFEGLKAYRTAQGDVQLFRPRLNFERMNVTNARMVIPAIDPDFCLQALKQLLEVEADWVPSAPGTSLYVRPFIIATDAFLGVRPAKTYKFMIILSPSGAYYPQGLNPIDIYVETDYVRAVRGGTGAVKTCGNYAASLLAQAEAAQKGFVQVLWLDGVQRRYIEEVGSMNVFFVIDGKLVTPKLNGSILPGITRRSVLELAPALGYETEERELAIDEVLELSDAGRIDEVFGAGTAAVISPVGKLQHQSRCLTFSNGKIGPLSQKLYDHLTGLQYGRIADDHGWIEKI